MDESLNVFKTAELGSSETFSECQYEDQLWSISNMTSLHKDV